jgi:hypothetical protein
MNMTDSSRHIDNAPLSSTVTIQWLFDINREMTLTNHAANRLATFASGVILKIGLFPQNQLEYSPRPSVKI